MYTEGYIKKIDLSLPGLWIDPAAPYQVKGEKKTYGLALKSGPLSDANTGEAIVYDANELCFRFGQRHIPGVINLKVSHCKVGVEYEGDLASVKLIAL